MLVPCREVVAISEVDIEQTRSQTTLCLASLIPRLPRLGVPTHTVVLWLARVAPLCWNGKHNTAIAVMCKCIVGLSVLGGYFRYSCDHSEVSQCPLYGVEGLSASQRLTEINRCFLICPFYRGFPHLGVSINPIHPIGNSLKKQKSCTKV